MGGGISIMRESWIKLFLGVNNKVCSVFSLLNCCEWALPFYIGVCVNNVCAWLQRDLPSMLVRIVGDP